MMKVLALSQSILALLITNVLCAPTTTTTPTLHDVGGAASTGVNPIPAAAAEAPLILRHRDETASGKSESSSCIRTWCLDRKTMMCLYDAGTTGWDPDRGPVPGITAMPLGPCTTDAPASAAAMATVVVTVTVTTTTTTVWV